MTIRPLFLLAFALSARCFSAAAQNAGSLFIEINNITAKTGDLHITVFNSQATFLKDKQYIFSKRVIVDGATPSSMRVELPNFPHGDYAISVYHDINNNHKLDQNAIGVPTEPYALSNNVNVKWRRPSFNECKVTFTEAAKTLAFTVKYWKER